MEWMLDPNQWVTLVILTVLEIVLGIDNIIFISIITDRLPEAKRYIARRFGVALALISRLALLASLAFIVKLTYPLFEVLGKAFSWRDIILFLGGLFLIYKATIEIHEKIEPDKHEKDTPNKIKTITYRAAMLQIMMLDIIFSLDSIITAVGLAEHLTVMALAVIIAVIIMLVAVNPICRLIDRHPTIKMLALSFLLLIGVGLIADGFGFHIPRGYLYVAMGFSVLVETLNILSRVRGK